MKTREEKIEELVENAVDCIDYNDLLEFFANSQREYYEALKDEEVNGAYSLNFE